ncbi:preprotein translocase subunit SecF [Methanomicrobium sp. W14]|uniref:protein translocase subunit SecF n=1 Tax=Methanomicrobium sp. W14 TaxID=2817839 RepID=UPI001AEB4810|nr:protein translocase subunit SecF [Methanomicrobium sp. W14]MBP2132801.1 preprotein translocase subunit SecF [Methanomicrobium sp. W14]
MGKYTYDINRYKPRQMVALPVGLLIVSIIFLAFNTVTTGMPVEPGIDFAGGVAVTLFTSDSPEDVLTYFSDYPLKSIGESINNGYYIVFDYLDDDSFKDLTEHVLEKYPDAKVDQIGETFGKTLQTQALWAIFIAFILMAVVVFFAFRNFVPSVAVVLSAFSDIVITASIMDVLGITLSLGTTAALLMLIGYSVDSDILLTTRLLKRQGKLDDKMSGAFRTGVIMTTTTITAVAAMFIVTAIGQVTIIRDMSAVLLIGLFVDLMNTWMLNAGLLKHYILKSKGVKHVR